jgi:hypothetical protein
MVMSARRENALKSTRMAEVDAAEDYFDECEVYG